MRITVDIVRPPGIQLAPSAVCRVQLRDATYVDDTSPVLAETVIPVADIASEILATVTLDAPDADRISPSNLNIWVHLDICASARVTEDDFVTTQAYTVPGGVHPTVRVEVNPAGGKR